MGAILEFLLEDYCVSHSIPTEPYNGRSGTSFANYIEAAIKCDLFGESRRWKIVQNDLREFRNYIHLQEAITSQEIDKNWYETIKPVFNSLLDKF